MDEPSWFTWIIALQAILTAEVSLEHFKSFFQLIFALSVGVSIWEGLIPTYFGALIKAVDQEADDIKASAFFRERPKAQEAIDKAIEEKGEKHKTRLANVIKWGRIFGALLAGLILLLLWMMGVFPELDYEIQRWTVIAATLVVICGFCIMFWLAKQCWSKWKGDLARYREVQAFWLKQMEESAEENYDREASGS